MSIKETEAEFLLSTFGAWYRCIKVGVWLCFSLTVLVIVGLLALVPSCHLLHVPAARGCVFGGVNFDGLITAFIFLNFFIVIGVAAILGILKQLLITFFVIRKGGNHVSP